MSTTREVAERIVKTLLYGPVTDYESARNAAVTDAIDQALQAERERAAKVANAHVKKNQDALDLAAGMLGTGMTQYALIERRDTAKEIETAIREGKPQK